MIPRGWTLLPLVTLLLSFSPCTRLTLFVFLQAGWILLTSYLASSSTALLFLDVRGPQRRNTQAILKELIYLMFSVSSFSFGSFSSLCLPSFCLSAVSGIKAFPRRQRSMRLNQSDRGESDTHTHTHAHTRTRAHTQTHTHTPRTMVQYLYSLLQVFKYKRNN